MRERKRENTNYQYQDERGDITRDYIDIKGIIRTYEQLYTNKFDNSVERDKFLERHKLPKITPEEINNLTSHMSTI